MPDMSAQSLEQFYIDLDADNHAQGRRRHRRAQQQRRLRQRLRDRRARAAQLLRHDAARLDRACRRARCSASARSSGRPILVTNQHSLSDAEDFTEGYRSLKLGTVVGEPTAGWIIYTWNQP